MSLTNNIRLIINSTLTGTVGTAAVEAVISQTVANALTNATDVFTVSGTTPADPFLNTYDLADDTIQDPLNRDVSFEQLEFIYFRNTSLKALTLGGGANDISVLADGLNVPAGGVVLLTGIYEVAALADQITVTGTTPAGDTYDLIIIGGDAPPEPEPE